MTANGPDPRVAQIARLFEHLDWADSELARAVTRSDAPAGAIREYAHVAGVEEVWLSRIQHRTPSAAIWPDISASDAASLATRTADAIISFVRGVPAATQATSR